MTRRGAKISATRQREANALPAARSASRLEEAGGAEERRRAGEGAGGISIAGPRRLQRISLGQAGSAPAQVPKRRREEAGSHALPAPPGLDEEAGERPDRLGIVAGEARGPVEAGQVDAAVVGAPPHRLPVREGQDPVGPAEADQLPQPPLRPGALHLRPALARLDAPPHAPAAAAGAVLPEEPHQLRPQARGEVAVLEVHWRPAAPIISR